MTTWEYAKTLIIIFFSDHHIRSDQVRSTNENLPFSISRLLSKSSSSENSSKHNNNNNESDRKSVEKDLSDSESGKTALSMASLQYTATGGIYSYPLYTSSGVLRVPPQRGYPPHGLHPAFPLHPAAALALKDRLAGEFFFLLCTPIFIIIIYLNVFLDLIRERWLPTFKEAQKGQKINKMLKKDYWGIKLSFCLMMSCFMMSNWQLANYFLGIEHVHFDIKFTSLFTVIKWYKIDSWRHKN